MVGPKSLEKLKCSHFSPRVSGRNRNLALKYRQKTEIANTSFTWMFSFLLPVTTVRLHKEGPSFHIWVTCLYVTATTIPQAENVLSSRCILAWPGKQPVLLLFRKAVPYLQRLQIRCWSVCSSSEHFKEQPKGRLELFSMRLCCLLGGFSYQVDLSTTVPSFLPLVSMPEA